MRLGALAAFTAQEKRRGACTERTQTISQFMPTHMLADFRKSCCHNLYPPIVCLYCLTTKKNY